MGGDVSLIHTSAIHRSIDHFVQGIGLSPIECQQFGADLGVGGRCVHLGGEGVDYPPRGALEVVGQFGDFCAVVHSAHICCSVELGHVGREVDV